MVRQSARSTPCPAPSSTSSVAPGISFASASPCASGNIGSDEPWITSVGSRDRRQGLGEPIVARDEVVVLQRRNVASAFHVPSSERTECRFIERALPGEHPGVTDEVLDHRLGIRPIHRRRPHEAPELLGRRWEPAITGSRGGGADQDEREHAIGEIQREVLRECRARRHADEVRGREAVGVEHSRGIGDQVHAAVPGVAGLVRGRSARVAVVVPDHEPPSVDEHPAEALVPPEHRRADAHDEEDRRVGRGHRTAPCRAWRRWLRSSARPRCLLSVSHRRRGGCPELIVGRRVRR